MEASQQPATVEATEGRDAGRSAGAMPGGELAGGPGVW